MERVIVYDVPNEGKGSLSRDVWHFWYADRRGLVLDYYAHEERDTTRKKFQPRSIYNRLSHNRSRFVIGVENIPEDKVPLPDWVKLQAKEIFMAALKVGLWERG